MNPRRSPAVVIAAVLLLLPVLYVGSYLALVVPRGIARNPNSRRSSFTLVWYHYRFGGRASGAVYWPLEQIDRKMRPDAWWEATAAP